MSNISTRLDKNQIIEQAKQRYELEQHNKLPTEIVSLPSNGLVYPEDSELRTGKIEIRYMTAYDEDILTNVSYLREGIMFDKLLHSIIVTKCNINEIISADRDAIIIQSRILAYGADYPVTITNPKTKKESSYTVNLSKLKHIPFNLTSDENGEFEYTFSDIKIKFSYNINVDSDTGVYSLLKQCIKEIDGNRNIEYIDEFIRYRFLAKDSKQFRTYYNENMPGLDYNYDFEGEDGGTFTAVFPIGADLFWF